MKKICEHCNREFTTPIKSLRFCNWACFRKYAETHSTGRPQLTHEDFLLRIKVKDSTCWIWTGPVRGQMGYGSFGDEYAHRYSYNKYIGPIPTGKMVCHHCDTPLCVNPAHLFIGSHSENMRDMQDKGRTAKGNKNGSRKHPERMQRGVDRHNAKLNPDSVRLMRSRYAGGARVVDVCKQFGITHSTAIRCLRGDTWKHVQ